MARMATDVRRAEEPMDEMGEITNTFLEQIPEEWKAIVIIKGPEKSSIGATGWDSDVDVMAHMIDSLDAMSQSLGMKLDVIIDGEKAPL